MNQEIDVLIVEDNESDAEMIVHVLKKNNFANRIFLVVDGAEALDFIFGEGAYSARQIEHPIKIILLDLKLPKINGKEVLSRIKGDARTRKIPVVMLTSSKEDPDIQKCYDLGANGYVVKPVDFNEFQKTITNLGLFWLLINEPPQ